MYEHPVYCLASQVMDLTIREYLHRPLPCDPPPPLLPFIFIFISSLSLFSPELSLPLSPCSLLFILFFYFFPVVAYCVCV